jgi:hypothetical protein
MFLPTRGRALVTPWVDTLCVGGASLVAAGLLFWPGAPSLAAVGVGGTLVLHGIINWPHFMASYRLLYASRGTVRKHRTAAIWVPAVIAAYGLVALLLWQHHSWLVALLSGLSALYLGRHYTGQTWGMMASFGYIDRVTYTPRERWLIRTGLHLMMLWHMAWAAANVSAVLAPPIHEPCQFVYDRMNGVFAAGALLGLAGLALIAVRQRAMPPVRVLVPWCALHGWYLLMARDSSAILLAQLAHALQYQMFPLRVQCNRNPDRVPLHLAARELGMWTLMGFAVLAGLPALFALCYRNAGGTDGMAGAVLNVISAAIALHHYFVDGTLYKLRNPEVRRDLFAHLTSPARAEPALAVAQAGCPALRGPLDREPKQPRGSDCSG